MVKKIIFIPLFFIGIVALLVWVVMALWNCLVPDIFGLASISFWQAAGLLALSKLLFGGFGGGKHKCCGHKHEGPNNSWKHKFKQHWMGMSEVDKQRWEQKFADRMPKKGCNPSTNSELNSTNTEGTETN